MEERTAQQLRDYLRERHPDMSYDVASECEPEDEEIEHEVPDEQSGNEDTDFDPPRRQDSEEENNEELEPQQERAGRRRSIVRGRNNFEWYVDAPETRGRRSSRVYLPSAEGQAKNVTTPLEAWTLLFSEPMLESIVRHTNEEIGRMAGDVPERTSYHRTIDIVELKAALGLLYFMGAEKNNHKNLEEMWSPQFGCNLYRAVMSERRFQYVLANIRFDDKETRSERRAQHGLAPIKDLWDVFVENCTKYYSPSTHCTIDEQLLGFRGRFSARVYMASKLDKCGIKIVTCNDAQTSYMLSAEPYVGRVETNPGEGVPAYYVTKLSKPIHNSERTVTCDNWFTSVSLVQQMKQQYSLTMVGTLQKNKREIPPSFTQTATAGTVRFGHADGMTLLSYCPRRNKVVLLLSSLHETGLMDESSGKPEIVSFYNATKGGTETFDQLCKNYTTSRVTARWPLRLFYGMLDQAGVNAAILYNLRAANNPLNRRSFLKELAFSLVKPQLEVRLRSHTLRRNIRNLINEVLGSNEHTPKDKVDKLDKRKRCSFCNWKSGKKTMFCCAACAKPVCEDHRTHYCTDCIP